MLIRNVHINKYKYSCKHFNGWHFNYLCSKQSQISTKPTQSQAKGDHENKVNPNTKDTTLNDPKKRLQHEFHRFKLLTI